MSATDDFLDNLDTAVNRARTLSELLRSIADICDPPETVEAPDPDQVVLVDLTIIPKEEPEA